MKNFKNNVNYTSGVNLNQINNIVKRLKVEKLDNLFDEFSEDFSFPIGVDPALNKLCDLMEACIITKNPDYIKKCYYKFETAQTIVNLGFYSPYFNLKEDQNNALQKIREKMDYYSTNEYVSKFLE